MGVWEREREGGKTENVCFNLSPPSLTQAISPSTRLAISSQMDATNLDKAPKVGMALALRN